MKKFTEKFQDWSLVGLMTVVFISVLLIHWCQDLFTVQNPLRPFLNIVIVVIFLLLSYLLERKIKLKDEGQILIYTLFFFGAGASISHFVYQNAVTFEVIVVYLGVSFLGAILWRLIRHFGYQKRRV